MIEISGYPSASYISTANESYLSGIKTQSEPCSQNNSSQSNRMHTSTQSPQLPQKYDETFNNPLRQQQFPVGPCDGSSGITPSFNALQSGLSYNVLAGNSPQVTSSGLYQQQAVGGDVMMGLQQPPQNYPSLSLSQSYAPMQMDYMQQSSRRIVRQAACNQETVQSQSDSPMTGVQMQQSPVLSS